MGIRFGAAKISNIFLGCLIILILVYFLVNGKCWVQESMIIRKYHKM